MPSKKESLRDKLEDNVLDLSLNELSVVPVKEIAALKQGTHLDLSCNLITSLPDSFCELTHLVKLDLSKNQLVSLPQAFGNLRNLRRVDLSGNNLVTLPVGLGHFKSLQWLDLKGNPLDERLQRVAGLCLDETQCKSCAKRMVAFMKEVLSEQERKRQIQLKEDRAKEAEKKAELERERELRKKEKLAEKEKRRVEYLEKQQEIAARQKQVFKSNGENNVTGHGDKNNAKTDKKDGLSCKGFIVSLLVLLIAVAIGLCVYLVSKDGNMPWKEYLK
ncbi:leucine-rich repeat-containing protein 59-like [Tubulanus polymorphus]|uniref:leucine-rich repeat-containing protein 59-like n=1 Tax=Tubulanus polymorphus TaxID=672921 RepID=UPI003DA27E1F